MTTCPRCQCQVFSLEGDVCRFCAVLRPDENLAAVNRMLNDSRKTMTELDTKMTFYLREFVVGLDRNVVPRPKM